VLVAVAYAYSLFTLVRSAAGGSPVAVLAVVPLLAVVLAWGRLRREEPPPPIHDRQVDYIVGIGLLLGALALAAMLPGSAGPRFWLARLDLLSLPLFAAGLTVLFYGIRRAWSLRWPLAVLLLAWPIPWMPVIEAAGSGAVAAAVLAVLLGTGGVAGVLDGARLARTAWFIGALVLILAGVGIGGVLAARAGETEAVAGALVAVLAVVAVLLSVLLAFLLSLSLPRVDADTVRRPARVPSPVTRLGAAPVVAGFAALLLAVVNVGYVRYGAVADDVGNPIRGPLQVEAALPAGWSAELADALTVVRPVLGPGVELERHLLVPRTREDVDLSEAIVLDRIFAEHATPLVGNGVDDTYWLPSDLRLTRRSVDVGAGEPAELRTLENVLQGVTRSILAWDWPVRAPDGTRYERIVLVIPDVSSPVVSVGTMPATTGDLAAHDAAERLLITLARQLTGADPLATAGASEVQP
jgi:hypothetical protein